MPHIAGFRGIVSGPAQPAERDPTRAIYRYHQRFAGPGRTFERKNLIVAVAMSPYADGVIRPHEGTTAASRDAALAKLRVERAHAMPILAGFRDPATEVDRLFRKTEGSTPTLEHTTADGTVHRLWRIQDAELLGKLRHYFAPRKLHLLDGHDRYEAMLAYRDELSAKPLPQYSSANYALACLVNLEDPTLASAPRHRVISGAVEIEQVLASARTHFLVEKLPASARDVAKQFAALRETVAHQPAFVVVFAGSTDAYKLTLSPDVSPFAEGAAPHRALQKLDPVVADSLFVARAMAGASVTTEVDIEKALATLDTGAAAIVVMRPLSIEQIAHVDELGQLLPPDSTAFHPAIAPLVTMPIDPDEDLV
ncbi:MAG: DUF1015 family protein [Deltaproteobacteria bacterium]|nr:DUF1015 family protein [Deltaproteobacteria bacterium]